MAGLPYLAQGDVIGDLDVWITIDNGKRAKHSGPAILLSNTCDADRDPQLVIAPGFRPMELERGLSAGTVDSIRRNENFGMLFLPEIPGIGDLVFDLARSHSVSRAFLQQKIETGEAHKHVSLSQLGYYFFLMKMTVFYLRPESGDVSRDE